MKASDLGFSDSFLKQIESFEGCILHTYLDSVGVRTIGIGHTKGVKSGMVITKEKAYQLLLEDLIPIAKAVNALGLKLTTAQRESIADFMFNLGIAAFKQSTLLKLIRKGAPTAQIQAEFKKWCHAGGKTLPGLVKRRAWEAERWAQ